MHRVNWNNKQAVCDIKNRIYFKFGSSEKFHETCRIVREAGGWGKCGVPPLAATMCKNDQINVIIILSEQVLVGVLVYTWRPAKIRKTT